MKTTKARRDELRTVLNNRLSVGSSYEVLLCQPLLDLLDDLTTLEERVRICEEGLGHVCKEALSLCCRHAFHDDELQNHYREVASEALKRSRELAMTEKTGTRSK